MFKTVANDGNEHAIWQQSGAAREDFFGELKDKRGVHLYRFGVDGATATICTISSCYEFVVNNSAVTVLGTVNKLIKV